MENKTYINFGFTVIKEETPKGNFLTVNGEQNVDVKGDVLMSVPIHSKFFNRLKIAWELFKYLK